jgi:predicted metal-dependent phosphoesterase TrpH
LKPTGLGLKKDNKRHGAKKLGYDLHTHSIYSDGSLRPEELIQKAIKSGLDGIALTDHDTVAGIEEAVAEAEKHKYPFLPGIELTTDYGDFEAHILGYNIDYTSSKLLQKIDAILESRNYRARLIIKKLNKARIPLSWEKVKAETKSRFIGRAHIYRALQSSGIIPANSGREAFGYYLGKNGLAYVPHQEIGTFEAINLIIETGGIPVLAHPGRMADEGTIVKLVNNGLRGIEVYYPTHTAEQTATYLKLAEKYQLIVTGGSDYHGAFSQTKLGDGQVTEVSNWYHPKISIRNL